MAAAYKTTRFIIVNFFFFFFSTTRLQPHHFVALDFVRFPTIAPHVPMLHGGLQQKAKAKGAWPGKRMDAIRALSFSTTLSSITNRRRSSQLSVTQGPM